jgi:hypothetical protein
MGQDAHQDWVITLPALHGLLEILDKEWEGAHPWKQRHLTASAGAFIAIAFCGSFRGNEVFLTDLYWLKKHLEESVQKD